MNVLDEFNLLATRLGSCQPQVTAFPSGAATLDLTIHGTRYSAEYFPSFGRYALSKVGDATYGWEGVDESFASASELEVAIERLLRA